MSNPLTPGTVPAASVLDATCLLALLLKEPGAAVVAAVLNHRALISAVNYHEVVAKLVDRGMTSSAINDALQLPFELIDFDEEQAMAAGLLRATTRSFGLSAGDRACLALALAYSLPALTADRIWINLPGTNVALIR